MPVLNVSIKSREIRRQKKFLVEFDVHRFERLAATFGLFNPGFLASIERAEQNIRIGKVRKIESLRELRNKK